MRTNDFDVETDGADTVVRYARPATIDEARTLLAEGGWTVLSGGTDFYPALGGRAVRTDVLDISGIGEMEGIRETGDHLLIGGRTSWSAISRAPLPAAFDGLKQAARDVGSVQIQNTGTIAGNLCNASPAADGVPALLTLDAEVELSSLRGVRHLPLRAFIRGNRDTALAPDELMTAIRIPKPSIAGRSAFHKLGARRYLVISIAMAAARIETGGDGRISKAAIAIGACSAVARRLGTLEADLIGREPREAAQLPDSGHFADLTPIDDVRATAGYRIHAAREIARRAIARALEIPLQATGQAA